MNTESKNEQKVEAEKESYPVIKLLRIQGIEPKMEIPFSWVVNNLMNPDYFLHICLYIKVPKPIGTWQISSFMYTALCSIRFVDWKALFKLYRIERCWLVIFFPVNSISEKKGYIFL